MKKILSLGLLSLSVSWGATAASSGPDYATYFESAQLQLAHFENKGEALVEFDVTATITRLMKAQETQDFVTDTGFSYFYNEQTLYKGKIGNPHDQEVRFDLKGPDGVRILQKRHITLASGEIIDINLGFLSYFVGLENLTGMRDHLSWSVGQRGLEVLLGVAKKNNLLQCSNGFQFHFSAHELYIQNFRGVSVNTQFMEKVENVSFNGESSYVLENRNVQIPAFSTIKVRARDYAWFTGIYDSERPLIKRSGNHWVLSFLDCRLNPLTDEELVAPYFDLEYYNTQLGEVLSLTQAVFHYLNHGAKVGLNPTRWFPTEKYQRYFETEINPFVDFLLQQQIATRREDRYIKIIDNTSLEDTLFTLLYQMRYKVLPQSFSVQTAKQVPDALRHILEEKGVLINSTELEGSIETIESGFIEQRIPWFKKYISIRKKDLVGKKMIFGGFNHNETGCYLEKFSEFTLLENGMIEPSPHENEVYWRFTSENHLEFLSQERNVTSQFVIKQQFEKPKKGYGFAGRYIPLRNRHHFLGVGLGIEELSELFKDFMFDPTSRLEIFYNRQIIPMYTDYHNKFEEEAFKVFEHEVDSLEENHKLTLMKAKKALSLASVLNMLERIPMVSHHLWLSKPDRPSYPNEGLIELCSNQLGKMDLENTFEHWIWANVDLPPLNRELELRGIDFRYKNPDEAYNTIAIKTISDVLIDNKLFGIAVNPLKFAILEKFGGIVMDFGVVLKSSFYEQLKKFKMILPNVPEINHEIDIYVMAATKESVFFRQVLNLLNSLDNLDQGQRHLIKYFCFGDACWLGKILTYFFDAYQQDSTLFTDFGSSVWTQRSRTWVKGTSGNNVIRYEPRFQIEGKTQLPIFRNGPIQNNLKE